MIQKFPFYNFLRIPESEKPEFSDCCHECGNIPFPVCFGSDLTVSLVINNEYYNIETDCGIGYVTPDGQHIKCASNVIYKDYWTFAQLTDDLSQIFAPGDCFRLNINDSSGDYNHYSPLFIYIGCEEKDTVLFEYWDDVDENKRFKIRLYALIENPQSKTDKSEYESINGNVISLSKKRRKEYDLIFYFYPENIHDSIKEMLMFPNILADELPVFESGDYNIDHNNSNHNNCAKASTKISEQDIIRFKIC